MNLQEQCQKLGDLVDQQVDPNFGFVLLVFNKKDAESGALGAPISYGSNCSDECVERAIYGMMAIIEKDDDAALFDA